MHGWCGEGAFKLKQDERCAARVELMEVKDGECGMEHCSSNNMVDVLMEMIDGECGEGAFKLKQDERCTARVELMEVMVGECGMGRCSSIKMVDELMVEVMEDECKDGTGKKHCSNIKIEVR